MGPRTVSTASPGVRGRASRVARAGPSIDAPPLPGALRAEFAGEPRDFNALNQTSRRTRCDLSETICATAAPEIAETFLAAVRGRRAEIEAAAGSRASQ
jgi:hypothetical protein